MNRHRYEEDVLAWSEEQAALLRAGETAGLDWQNLAEEIESLGKSQKSELRSRLALVIQHLLKYKFQPGHRSRSWSTTIRVQRDELEGLLATTRACAAAWRRPASRLPQGGKRRDGGDGPVHFPEDCPFTLDQIMDPDWLPE